MRLLPERLAGIMDTARYGMGSPVLATGMELAEIAAVVIAGQV